jgi:tetratricopeptide (TPR) repeat protein
LVGRADGPADSLDDGVAHLTAIDAARTILLRAAVRLARIPRVAPALARKTAAFLWTHSAFQLLNEELPPSALAPWLAPAVDVGESAVGCDGHRRLVLARCCHAAAEYDQAAEHLAAIRRGADAMRCATLLRAELFLRRGDPSSAIELLLSALDDQPQGDLRGKLHNTIGCCYARLGNTAAAAVSFCHALRECRPWHYTVAAYNCATVHAANAAHVPAAHASAAEQHVVEVLVDALIDSGGAVHRQPSSPLDFCPDTANGSVTILAAPQPHLQAVRDLLMCTEGAAEVGALHEEAEAVLLRRAAWLALLCKDYAKAESLLSQFFACSQFRWVYAPPSGLATPDMLRQSAVAKLLQGKRDECITICVHLTEVNASDTETLLIRVAAACQLERWTVVDAAISDPTWAQEDRFSIATVCWIAVARARCAIGGQGAIRVAIDELRRAAVRCPTHPGCMQFYCHLLRHHGDSSEINEAAVNWTVFTGPTSSRSSFGHAADPETMPTFALVRDTPIAAPDGFAPTEMGKWAATQMKKLRPAQIAILAIEDVLQSAPMSH